MTSTKLAGSISVGAAVRVAPGRFPGIVFRPDGGDEGGSGGGDGQGGDGKGGAGDGSQGGGKGASQGGPDDGKLDFNPTQQAWLEKKFNEAYRKGAEKSEAQLKAENERLTNELKKLQGKKPDGKPAGEGESKTYTQEDVKRLIEEAMTEPTNRLAAAEARATSLLSKDRQAAIVAAASKANVAGDYREFSKLVIDAIIHDDKGSLVVSEDGTTTKLNSKGDPISVDEYVKAYVDARPHLKKGTGTAGAGSSSAAGSGAGGGSGAKPKTMTEANAALARAFGGQK